ncbi:MAG TPA: type II CAAX endopeptidase family protein [Panacibacter sp.]|nr:type II CAAX endopeptidase family protein [Panacibacter sp.]HNP43597.1 type II CAAX endopeptidase family protein [Panacibacter sp.]
METIETQVPGSSKRILITGILLAFLLPSVVLLADRYFLPVLHIDILSAGSFFISRCLLWISLAVLWLYAKRKEQRPFLLWNEKEYDAGFYVAALMIMMLVIFAGSVGISLLIKLAGPIQQSSRFADVMKVLQHNYPLMFFTLITAGIMEELVFRGYLLPRLNLLFKNKWLSIVLSSILFGLIHLGWGTIQNVVVPFFIGIIFAIFYERYRNIKILMLCHFLWDLLVLSLSLASASGKITPHQ